MDQDSVFKSPKKEQQIVPDSVIAEFFESSTDDLLNLKGISGIKDNENKKESVMSSTYDDETNWYHLIECDELSINDDDDDQDSGVCNQHLSQNEENMVNNVIGNIKNELCGVWEDKEEHRDQKDDKNMCLNLSLNFQNVMDAWSNRGPCWTDDFTHSISNDYVS